MKKALFIFHRDFRLDDNISLIEALKNFDKVIPIFIFTKEQIINNKYKSYNAIQFMIESLEDLEKQLHLKGGKLNFFFGSIQKIINNILKNNQEIQKIYFNKDYTPYATKRDNKFKKELVESFEDYYLNPIGSITNTTNTIYMKFTPYYNKAKNIPIKNNIQNKYNNYDNIIINKSITLDKIKKKIYKKNINIWQNGGRTNALKILNNLKNNKYDDYNKNRNFLIYNTTNLSAYIKFGCISIREVYHSISSNNDLIKQLYWRDFYMNILWKYPLSINQNLKYPNIKWNNNINYFKKWCNGQTGFPVIDAAMNQLNLTGYMHNRGRLIVSNFLIKILLIDWKWGATYFSKKLYDYCPAQNSQNWQWSASTGVDSQPYFRIFNPWIQSKKFDLSAEYIKKYIPILQNIVPEDIHNWFIMYKKYPNINYPKPIVNYTKRKKMFLHIWNK